MFTNHTTTTCENDKNLKTIVVIANTEGHFITPTPI
jgi:hypothetical protein